MKCLCLEKHDCIVLHAVGLCFENLFLWQDLIKVNSTYSWMFYILQRVWLLVAAIFVM